MAETPAEKPKRRPRYRGTHPRQFHEKYKEHQPERYQADVAKVLASGKTPAGSHRPILVREVMEVLAPKPGEIAVDATLGYGGHAVEMLRRIRPGGRLYGLDADPIELPKTEARLRAAGYGEAELIVRRTNFAGLAQVLAAEGVDRADVILADLGLSSMQIDDPTRGFTCKRPGPLDLRMNPQRGQSAAVLLAGLDETRLERVLVDNADEPHAGVLARAMVQAGKRTPLSTTTALVKVVAAALEEMPGDRSRDQVELSVRRVFQALRIVVNDEFSALETFLRRLPDCLKPGGRVAVLTFHSGEDRRVKKAFRAGRRDGVYSDAAEDVVRSTKDETFSNRRAAAAKLRWAVR